MTEPYNQGGLIDSDGEQVKIRVEIGERCITADQTVYELQACDDGARWVEIGKGWALWMGGPK